MYKPHAMPNAVISFPGQLRQAAMLETDPVKRRLLTDAAQQIMNSLHALNREVTLSNMAALQGDFSVALRYWLARTPLADPTPPTAGSGEIERKAA